MVLQTLSSMTQSTLVEICHHNLQTTLLTQIGVAEYRTWKQLVLQGEKEEEIVAMVKIEEKESKLRLEKPTRPAPEYLLNQTEGTCWQQRLSLLPSLSRLEGAIL